jgi:hypothetical protein
MRPLRVLLHEERPLTAQAFPIGRKALSAEHQTCILDLCIHFSENGYDILGEFQDFHNPYAPNTLDEVNPFCHVT